MKDTTITYELETESGEFICTYASKAQALSVLDFLYRSNPERAIKLHEVRMTRTRTIIGSRGVNRVQSA